MRSLRGILILMATAAGGWLAGESVLGIAFTPAAYGGALSPVAGLLIAPAVLFGALLAALLAGLLLPRR